MRRIIYILALVSIAFVLDSCSKDKQEVASNIDPFAMDASEEQGIINNRGENDSCKIVISNAVMNDGADHENNGDKDLINDVEDEDEDDMEEVINDVEDEDEDDREEEVINDVEDEDEDDDEEVEEIKNISSGLLRHLENQK